MNNVEVTYAGGGKADETKYTYSPLRYWPNDEANNKLSFFAYYPQGGQGITAPTMVGVATASLLRPILRTW